MVGRGRVVLEKGQVRIMKIIIWAAGVRRNIDVDIDVDVDGGFPCCCVSCCMKRGERGSVFCPLLLLQVMWLSFDVNLNPSVQGRGCPKGLSKIHSLQVQVNIQEWQLHLGLGSGLGSGLLSPPGSTAGCLPLRCSEYLISTPYKVPILSKSLIYCRLREFIIPFMLASLGWDAILQTVDALPAGSSRP